MKLISTLTAIFLGLTLGPGLLFLALGQAHPSGPSLANSVGEKAILDVQAEMVKNNTTYLSVPEQDGKTLRVLTEAVGARKVLEIGTSTGYSGLWFCLALRATGGHLTTL